MMQQERISARDGASILIQRLERLFHSFFIRHTFCHASRATGQMAGVYVDIFMNKTACLPIQGQTKRRGAMSKKICRTGLIVMVFSLTLSLFSFSMAEAQKPMKVGVVYQCREQWLSSAKG